MVGDVCGLHAQVMSSAELSAAVRLDGLACGTVARALWEDRSLVARWPARRRTWSSRKAGWISPVLMVDGELAGVWTHTETDAALAVEVKPLAKVGRAVTTLATAEAGRLGVHLAHPVKVTFSTPS